MNQTAGSVWADASTQYVYPAQLPGSGNGERWVSNSTLTGVVNSAVSASPQYNHQFMVTINTNPPLVPVLISQQSGWYNAGQSLDVSVTSSRTWQFEGWQGIGPASFTGNRSSLFLTITSPVTETATVYASLLITASGTGSVSYSFGNVTGSVPQGQSRVVYVPPGQTLNIAASPFPVFYSFSEWNGTFAGGRNSTASSQNPLTFSINTPSDVTGFFKINLLGVILIPLVVVVGVVSIFLFRRRGSSTKESAESDDEDTEESETS